MLKIQFRPFVPLVPLQELYPTGDLFGQTPGLILFCFNMILSNLWTTLWYVSSYQILFMSPEERQHCIALVHLSVQSVLVSMVSF